MRDAKALCMILVMDERPEVVSVTLSGVDGSSRSKNLSRMKFFLWPFKAEAKKPELVLQDRPAPGGG